MPKNTLEIRLPQSFGEYDLVKVVSEGDRSIIFQGLHRKLSTTVLIKRIHPATLSDKGVAEHFSRISNIHCTLNHPNILRAVETGNVDGEPFLILDTVNDAIPLNLIIGSFINNHQRLPEDLALFIITATLKAMSYINHYKDDNNSGLDLIINNLTADNILVGIDGEIKLFDFDINLSSDPSLMKIIKIPRHLTRYTAPEVFLSLSKADRRSDIYSAGVILFELLSGKKYISMNVQDDEIKILIKRRMLRNLHPAPSDVDISLSEYDTLIDKAVQFDPDKRFQTSDDFLLAVEKTHSHINSDCSTDSLGQFFRQYNINIASGQSIRNQTKTVVQTITRIS